MTDDVFDSNSIWSVTSDRDPTENEPHFFYAIENGTNSGWVFSWVNTITQDVFLCVFSGDVNAPLIWKKLAFDV